MTTLFAFLTPYLGAIAAVLVIVKLFFFGAVSTDLGIDFDSFSSMMKELYSPKKVAELIYKKNKFLARIPRNKDFVAESLSIGLKYGNPTGVGGDFTIAKANTNPGKYGKFVLPGRKEMFGFVSINHHLIKATKGDAGSLLRAKGEEIDGMLQQMGRRQAIQLWRAGGGTQGQIQSSGSLATTSITLQKLSDVRNFELNQIIKLHSAESGGVTRAGRLQIVAINRSTGVLTVDDNISTSIGTASTSDFISIEGDYGKSMMGVAGYIPTSAPTSAPFFGLDRSGDTVRLAGTRLDLRGWGYEEAVIELLTQVGNEGGSPNAVYMNPLDWSYFERALGSKVHYEKVGSEVGIGFKAIMVYTEDGEAAVISDINVPSGLMYALQEDTWCLNSIGETPALWDEDGILYLRSSTENGLDVQAYSYHEVSCNAPGWNGVAQIG